MTIDYPKCWAKFNKQSLERLKAINKSIESEHGASLCMDRDMKINIRNICTGDKCSVNIETENACRRDEIELGDFHTHVREVIPFPIDLPSPDDWYDWIDNFLSCLGTKNGIKCYQKKRDNSEEMDKMISLATIMKYTESNIDTEHPDFQQPELKRLKKYNEELETYYYKFDPNECKIGLD